MSTLNAQSPAGAAVVPPVRNDDGAALPHRWLRVVRLHYADPAGMLVTTPVTLALLTLLSVAVHQVLRAFVVPEQMDLGPFFAANLTVLLTLPGSLAGVGAFSWVRTMPYTVGMLGCTRGEYWRGTMLWAVLQALYTAAVVVGFLLLETATGTWFTGGAHVVAVTAFGGGHPGQAALVAFSVAWGSLLLGGCLGIAWLRWKQWGVIGGLLLLAVALLGVGAGLLAAGVDLVGFFAQGTLVKLCLVLLVVAVAAGLSSRALLVRAPVAR